MRLLVSIEHEVDIVRLLKDKDGRFLKIRIRDWTIGISTTSSSVLVEPKGVFKENTISKRSMGINYIGAENNETELQVL